MSEDAVWQAFLKKYARVYDAEANEAAIVAKEAQKQRKVERNPTPARAR